MTSRIPTDIDVKNLCSRKLLELCAQQAADRAELGAIIDELQLRRHYLNELAQLQPARAAQH